MGQNYKHTLNLPRTDFPMKANLPSREPERLRNWKEALQQLAILYEDRLPLEAMAQSSVRCRMVRLHKNSDTLKYENSAS